MRQVNVHSLEETEALAAERADGISSPRIILLEGTLGMGKSSFARAFIRHLCGAPEMEVPSPTFTLVQGYDSAKGEIWHFDLYRLEDPEEIWELGWEDALSDHICLIEWPDRLGHYTPDDALRITITAGDAENSRIFTIEN
ncbi:MAG: tRNA (adenosine(37)-N6)-threonylcarbamoyltransferase complex ATPase subunit type 1 TsaE [Pseudomonadota bacterium]|nr:tRNA (adenosine(37)-N6)-threonylcarbamoyltransferase complex ATPase subunit type 1 TsaE [Pseudomonadota bacterium]